MSFVPSDKLLEIFSNLLDRDENEIELPVFHESLSLVQQISEEVEGVLSTFVRHAAANNKNEIVIYNNSFTSDFKKMLISFLYLDLDIEKLAEILNEISDELFNLARNDCKRFWGTLAENENCLIMYINYDEIFKDDEL